MTVLTWTQVASAGEHVAARDIAAAIEQAHGKTAWAKHQAVREAFTAHAVVRFGGGENTRTVIDGRMTFDAPVGRSRIEQADGTLLVFDGSSAWVSPAEAPFPRARFHALTWPYFVAAPFKLTDPGTHHHDAGELPWDGATQQAVKLTFAENVGDAPDDWYLLFRDEQGRLAGMAYIVTYGHKDPEQAARNIHAIRYDQFVDMDGAAIPVEMSFWNWNATEGLHGEPIGHITLTDPGFVPIAADTFTRPDEAREDELPTAE